MNSRTRKVNEEIRLAWCEIYVLSVLSIKDIQSSAKHRDIVHERNWPFKCEVCPKSYQSKYLAQIHARSAREKRKLSQCAYCDKPFHENRKLSQFAKCDKPFQLKYQLEKHVSAVYD